MYGNVELSGGVATQLGELSQLEQVYLDNTNLSGEMPSEICALRAPEGSETGLVELTADCLDEASPAKVVCSCCTECFGSEPSTGTDITDPVSAPVATPIEVANSDEASQLQQLITELSPQSTTALADVNSFQHMAMIWLLDDPELSNYDDQRTIDRFSLMTFYLSSTPETWTEKTGWGEYGSECDYYGIECEDARVVAISLEANNLKGPALVRELGNLNTSLRSLVLSNNVIEGSIVSEIGKLTQLVELRLDVNELTTQIPSEIGNLVDLEVLKLWDSTEEDSNLLTGPLPCSAFANLAKVTELEFNDNEINGTLCKEFAQMKALKILRLDDNFISGDVSQDAWIGCNAALIQFIF